MRKTLTTRFLITVILSAALLVSMFAFVFGANGSSANAQTITSTSASSNQALLQFEWPQFMGDAEFSRLGSGPAPSTSDILWKADMPNIMSYLAAFNGMIFDTDSDELNRNVACSIQNRRHSHGC
jgi:hypothetical protein